MNREWLESHPYFIKKESCEDHQVYYYRNGLRLNVYAKSIGWDWDADENKEKVHIIWKSPVWFRELYQKAEMEVFRRQILRNQLKRRAEETTEKDIYFICSIVYDKGKEWYLQAEKNEESLPSEASEYIKECQTLFEKYGLDFQMKGAEQ